MAKTKRLPPKPAKSLADCFTCQSRQRSQWCALENEDLQLLNQARTCAVYEPGQVLFHQGDDFQGLFCIESGTVALRKTDEHGNSVLLRLCHAGDSIGYREFFSGGPAQVSADALVRSSVCYVRSQAVHKLLESNPALGLTFLRKFAADLGDAEETILQSASLPIRTRLAHLLLALKERYATVDDDGVMTIALPLARQDIAAILGSRPETVARTIHALETDAVARFSGRRVIVDDLDLLLDEIEPHG